MQKPKTLAQMKREQSRELSVLKSKHKKELQTLKGLRERWRGGTLKKTARRGSPSKERFADWHRKYGDDFTYSHLHSKRAAQARAESLRKKGKTARVVKGNYVIVTSKKRRRSPKKRKTVARRKEIRRRAQELGLIPSWL